ncbi:MAG: ATP-binding protein [Gammaproteobacteria bacterium]|nr:ATP-binding protein [Gammaproteobacteria bacterium]
MRRRFHQPGFTLLLILFVSFGLIASGGAIILVGYEGQNLLLLRQAQNSLEVNVRATGDRFRAAVNALGADARFLSIIEPVNGYARSLNGDRVDPKFGFTTSRWLQLVGGAFVEMATARPDYLEIRLLTADASGRELVRVSRGDGTLEVVAGPELKRKTDNPYFQKARLLGQGGIYFSEINLSRDDGKIQVPRIAVIRVVAPVFDSRGKRIALVVINQDFSAILRSLINLEDEGFSSRYFVLNDRGDYLYHPDYTKQFAFEFGDHRNAVRDFPGLVPIIEHARTHDSMTGGLDHHDDHTHSHQSDGSVRRMFTHFDLVEVGSPGFFQKFFIGISADYDDIIAGTHDIVVNTILVAALILLSSVLATVVFSQIITRPIRNITEWVNSDGRGDTAGKLPLDDRTEVGVLARSFLGLVNTLRSSEQRLVRKNQELVARNRELDQFAYIASHDLKSPLRAITSLSEWLEEDIGDTLSEESREQLRLLRSRARRMDDLINGILLYSRVGREAIASEDVNFEDLLDEIWSDSVQQGCTLVKHVNVKTIHAEAVLLRQVLANLVGNAVKHGDSDRIIVQVSAKIENNACVFDVTDDGPGIPKEYHDKVFRIFQTLQARDTRESAGIGLTIVKKIIDEHGGSISLESPVENNHGTRFRVVWPL